MVGITERNQQKLELTNLGFSLKYIDESPAKTTLYRHKPSYDVSGVVAEGIGTTVKGVPGNPDYVLRKAKIGLFPWVPSEKCKCQWCVVAGYEQVEEPALSVVASAPEPVRAVGTQDGRSKPAKIQCDVCGHVAEGASLSGAQSKLRGHAKSH